uniref:Extensin-like n=1 Tax=Diabrotica virgifera virgifera TaxID=50390 RepID=A0A6P7FJ25_DIAVI
MPAPPMTKPALPIAMPTPSMTKPAPPMAMPTPSMTRRAPPIDMPAPSMTRPAHPMTQPSLMPPGTNHFNRPKNRTSPTNPDGRLHHQRSPERKTKIKSSSLIQSCLLFHLITKYDSTVHVFSTTPSSIIYVLLAFL